MIECGSTESYVAMVFDPFDEWPADANARLIAAAPAMLAALKLIAKIQYNRLDAENGDITEHAEIAEAAIAKAEA